MSGALILRYLVLYIQLLFLQKNNFDFLSKDSRQCCMHNTPLLPRRQRHAYLRTTCAQPPSSLQGLKVKTLVYDRVLVTLNVV